MATEKAATTHLKSVLAQMQKFGCTEKKTTRLRSEAGGVLQRDRRRRNHIHPVDSAQAGLFLACRRSGNSLGEEGHRLCTGFPSVTGAVPDHKDTRSR
jgi:hypothetical protein